MPAPLVTAVLTQLHELRSLVGTAALPDDPVAALRAVGRDLDDAAADGRVLASRVDAAWSGAAADAASDFGATTLAGLQQAAVRARAIAARVGTASDAVARADRELQRIIDDFTATAAQLSDDTPAGAEALVAAARRALEDARAVIAGLEAELDHQAAGLRGETAAPPAPAAVPAATTPAGFAGGMPSGAPSSAPSSAPVSSGWADPAESASFTGDPDEFGEGVEIRLPDGSTVRAPNAVAADAVRHALTQLGVPYRWGGTSPGVGLDCSGLTQWAYHQAGLDLPRLAQEQDVGSAVPAGALRPGDLAVWDGHVAMIVGNGTMIEAGDPVQLSPIRTTNAGQGFQGFWRPTG